MENHFIRCVNRQKADIRFQDGALPYVLGAKNYQVVRACREEADKPWAWTYNHAPMLAFWNGKFWIEYLSGPTGEHIPPSRTLLTDSQNGVNWSEPREIFPPVTVERKPYCGPGANTLSGEEIHCVMHQRMGFFVSGEDRLLVLGFYGISPTPDIAPNNGYGLGRAVREVYRDGSLSPIYYLRKNIFGGYSPEQNQLFPPYTQNPDEGFQRACRELLDDKIVRQQWWEEERFDREYFGIEGGKAVSCYTLPNGRILGVCKNALVTETDSEGEKWEPFVKCSSLETSTGKVWGQRTLDGRYALVYNPSTDGAHRWPLAVVSGEDGREFDGLSALTPEISPCRYGGVLKNLGAQYVRGIWESYPQPQDGGMWLTYSVNKEDIWAAKVPVPIRNEWKGDIDERPDGESIRWWNIRSLKWAPVYPTEYGSKGNSCLCMEDAEPCDRPLALRIFEEAERFLLTAELCVQEADGRTGLVAELQDRSGRTPVRLRFGADCGFYIRSGGREIKAGEYAMGSWFTLEVAVSCNDNAFTARVYQEGRTTEKKGVFSQSVHALERVLFTTKTVLPWNTLEDSGREGNLPDLPDSGRKTGVPARLYIGRLRVKGADSESPEKYKEGEEKCEYSFQELAEEFQCPGADYGTLLFWSWNNVLDEEEIRRQIRLFKDGGAGGFFIHAREGLLTQYMGEEWMHCVRAAVEEAEKNELEVWLYDEDRWPSGGAAGKVCRIGQDAFRLKGLTLEVCGRGSQAVLPHDEKLLAA